MLVFTLLGILIVLVNWLIGFYYRKKSSLILASSMFLIGVFLSIRYNFGNDYLEYLRYFNECGSVNNFDEIILLKYEYGWTIINILFSKLGFFSLVIFLSFFHVYCLYLLIIKFVDYRFWWFSLFLLFFDVNQLLIQASTMRQTLAIDLFIIGFVTLYSKARLTSYFLFASTILFHFSAVVLIIPFILYHFTILISSKKFVSLIVYSIFFVLLFFVRGEEVLSNLGNNGDSLVFLVRYLNYTESGEIRTGVGFLYFYLLLFFHTWNYWRIQETNKYLFSFSLFGLLLVPIGASIEMIGRLGLFVSPMYSVTFPIILKSSKELMVKFLFMLLVFIFITVKYVSFFYSKTYYPYYYEYRTIFSVNIWQ